MDAYFDAWLERDYASDHRPSPSNPVHLDLYLDALESIAVKYLTENLVDDSGYFPVAEGSTIEVEHDGQRLSFPIQQVLDRSGMKHVDPRISGVPRYRFEPIWFHRLLIDRYNDRRTGTVRFVGHQK